MVGVDVEHPPPVTAHHLTATRRRLGRIETEEGHRPPSRICQGAQLSGPGSGQMGHERWPDRPPPARRSGEHGPDRATGLETETLECVDGAQHLSHVGALRVELEGDVVPVADHDVPTAGETVTIDLVAVPEAGLGHPMTVLHLGDEAADIEEVVSVEPPGVLRDDSAEQDAPETGRRVDRKNEVPEGDPTGRLDGAGMEDLELGQHHGQTVPVGGRRVAASARCARSDPRSTDVAQILGRRGHSSRFEVGRCERRSHLVGPLEHPSPHPESDPERCGLG